MLNKNQKEELFLLKEHLARAKTAAELYYYSNELKELIDTAKEQSQKVFSLFTKEQLKLYKEYRHHLMNARYISGVRYYGVKLHQLIDEILKDGAYKEEYNLNSEQIEAYYEYRYKMKSITPFKSRYRNRIKSIIPEKTLAKIESANNS